MLSCLFKVNFNINRYPTNAIYMYIELLVKSEILTSYIYGPTFGNCVNPLPATKITLITNGI
jgi:hypothetical protein